MSAARPALIYNPRAGKLLRARHRFQKALDVLRARWPELTLIETTGPKSAGPQARAAVEEGADLIIACGGDGTVNEVAQSLSGTDVPVGILPGGTACVLANEIGIGNDLVRAARLLSDSEACDVSTGILRQGEESTSFLLMAGIGFDALLVHGLELETKERWGKLAYWWAAIREIGRRLDRFRIVVDGTELSGTFAIVSRVRNYGGDVSIARGASLLAEEFEIVLFETTSVVRLAWLLATGVLTATLDRKRDVTVCRGKQVSAASEASRIHVQVDGEAAGFLPATIEIVPSSMRLLVPRRWLEKERRRG